MVLHMLRLLDQQVSVALYELMLVCSAEFFMISMLLQMIRILSHAPRRQSRLDADDAYITIFRMMELLRYSMDRCKDAHVSRRALPWMLMTITLPIPNAFLSNGPGHITSARSSGAGI